MLPQISLYLPNKAGQLSKALNALSEGDVNVQAFSIEQAGPYSAIRLVCHPHKKGIDQLRKYTFGFSEENVFAVSLSHESGQLRRVMELFGTQEINVEYGYLTVISGTNQAVVIIKIETSKEKAAEELLKKHGFKSLNEIPEGL